MADNCSNRSKRVKLSESPLVGLIQSQIYAPIRDGVLRYLDTKDVLRLCSTSTKLRQHILPVEWNINARLRRFLKDPIAFRNQLGRSDALISGSFALQFFERVIWQESDLDIVVEEGTGADKLAEYLIRVEGYERSKNQDFEAYRVDDIDGVRSVY